MGRNNRKKSGETGISQKMPWYPEENPDGHNSDENVKDQIITNHE